MQNNKAGEYRKESFVKLFQVLESPNGTVSIFNLEDFLLDGDFYFVEFPNKSFNIQDDKAIIQELLEHYRNGGIKAAEEYLQTI